MTNTADAEQLLAILRRLLVQVVDEVVTEKIARAMRAQPAVVTPEQTGSSTRRNVSMQEAAEMLGVHEATIYRMCKQGEIGVIRLGRRTLVPMREVERLCSPSVQVEEPAPTPAQRSLRIPKRRLAPTRPMVAARSNLNGG